jgi:murein endopeptidase
LVPLLKQRVLAGLPVRVLVVLAVQATLAAVLVQVITATVTTDKLISCFGQIQNGCLLGGSHFF